MSLFNRRKDENALRVQPTAANAPDAKPESLPSILRTKLVALAESGDVSAIKLLLEKEHLWAEKPEPVTLEEARQQLAELLAKGQARARAINPNYVADRFAGAIAERLRDDGLQELSRRWEKLSAEAKAGLWGAIVKAIDTERWPREVEITVRHQQDAMEKLLDADSPHAAQKARQALKYCLGVLLKVKPLEDDLAHAAGHLLAVLEHKRKEFEDEFGEPNSELVQ